MNAHRFPRPALLMTVCLAAGTMLAYLPLHRNGFIDIYDDYEYVIENSRVNAGPSPASIAWAFTEFHAVNWHPLTWISHMIDCRLYGLAPGGHHLTNLLLHVANVLLLFGLLRSITGALWRSALVAAVFAVHPANVQNVAWIAERKELLSTFFGLLTIMAYGKYARGQGGAWFTASLLFYACALMSKQMLVTMPALLLLLDWWPFGRLRIADCRLPIAGSASVPSLGKSAISNLQSTILPEKLPFLLFAVAASVVVLVAQSAGGAVASVEHLPMTARIGNALIAYVTYLGKFIAPHGLAIVYPYPESISWNSAGLAAAAIAGLTVAAAVLRRKQPWLLAGWLWFLGTLVPVIGLVQVGGQQMADRYLYVPMMGLLVAMVWGLADRLRIAQSKTATEGRPVCAVTGMAAGVAWAVCLAVLTQRELPHWRDSVALFSRAIATTKRNYFAHYNLGLALATAGRYAEAADQYRASIAIKPTFDAINNLGVALLKAGQPRGALNVFATAAAIKPEDPEVLYNLGIAYGELGRIDSALACYAAALQRNPRHWKALNNAGILFARQELLDSAIDRFTRSIEVNPDNPQTYLKRGVAYREAGEKDSALADHLRALAWYPNDARLLLAVGGLYEDLGRTADAEEMRRRAASIKK